MNAPCHYKNFGDEIAIIFGYSTFNSVNRSQRSNTSAYIQIYKHSQNAWWAMIGSYQHSSGPHSSNRSLPTSICIAIYKSARGRHDLPAPGLLLRLLAVALVGLLQHSGHTAAVDEINVVAHNYKIIFLSFPSLLPFIDASKSWQTALMAHSIGAALLFKERSTLLLVLNFNREIFEHQRLGSYEFHRCLMNSRVFSINIYISVYVLIFVQWCSTFFTSAKILIFKGSIQRKPRIFKIKNISKCMHNVKKTAIKG